MIKYMSTNTKYLRESAKSADFPLKYNPQIAQIFTEGTKTIQICIGKDAEFCSFSQPTYNHNWKFKSFRLMNCHYLNIPIWNRIIRVFIFIDPAIQQELKEAVEQ